MIDETLSRCVLRWGHTVAWGSHVLRWGHIETLRYVLRWGHMASMAGAPHVLPLHLRVLAGRLHFFLILCRNSVLLIKHAIVPAHESKSMDVVTEGYGLGTITKPHTNNVAS